MATPQWLITEQLHKAMGWRIQMLIIGTEVDYIIYVAQYNKKMLGPDCKFIGEFHTAVAMK